MSCAAWLAEWRRHSTERSPLVPGRQGWQLPTFTHVVVDVKGAQLQQHGALRQEGRRKWLTEAERGAGQCCRLACTAHSKGHVWRRWAWRAAQYPPATDCVDTLGQPPFTAHLHRHASAKPPGALAVRALHDDGEVTAGGLDLLRSSRVGWWRDGGGARPRLPSVTITQSSTQLRLSLCLRISPASRPT